MLYDELLIRTFVEDLLSYVRPLQYSKIRDSWEYVIITDLRNVSHIYLIFPDERPSDIQYLYSYANDKCEVPYGLVFGDTKNLRVSLRLQCANTKIRVGMTRDCVKLYKHNKYLYLDIPYGMTRTSGESIDVFTRKIISKYPGDLNVQNDIEFSMLPFMVDDYELYYKAYHDVYKLRLLSLDVIYSSGLYRVGVGGSPYGLSMEAAAYILKTQRWVWLRHTTFEKWYKVACNNDGLAVDVSGYTYDDWQSEYYGAKRAFRNMCEIGWKYGWEVVE